MIWTLGFTGLFGRLAFLQIIRKDEYTNRATAQRMRPEVIDAQRGNILDRNHKNLAMSVGADAVYALPDNIVDVQGTATQLAPYLTLSVDDLVRLLSNTNSVSVWLERGLSLENARAIRELKLPGIRLVKRPQRYYPQGSLAAHVIGIAGSDNQGLEGIEYYYDSTLRGIPGKQSREKDASDRNIPGGKIEFIPPQAGYDLILTIDSVIQHMAEKKLQEAVMASQSDRGLVLIMNPTTGEILANAIFPTFDPNNYQRVKTGDRRNIAITDQYEPGSTFKFVTAAAGLELNLTHSERSFQSGLSWDVGGGKVRNSEVRTVQNVSFLEAMERSDNIVFAKLAVELGPEKFHQAITNFGFGAKLGVDFPGEISGTVLSPYIGGRTLQWANIGFGQGIAVTPLQLLSAVNSVANGGKVLKPYFVKEIRDYQGKLVEEFKPVITQTAISKDTATSVSQLLRSVVVNGNGNRAEVDGYFIAGKTGTAEVPKNGGYGEERIASFVGFAPVDDPALSVLVLLFNPKVELAYGGVIAAPLFRDIMGEGLENLGIKRRQISKSRSSFVTVPNLSGLSPTEAMARLSANNLQWSLVGDGNFVREQTPGPGSRVTPQTTIHLSFQDKDDFEEVTIPSILGLSMRDASAKLSEYGLRIVIKGSGIAKKQSPSAGVKVPKGSVIEVNFEI